MIADWESLRRARRGDESGWRELLKKHQARLVSMVLLLVGDPAAAQDIAQETFTRLLSADLPNREGSVGGWLSTTAFRLALKEKRRAKRNSDIEGVDPPDPSQSPLDSLLVEERDRQIVETIRGLDDAHREILILRFYGGHSYEEIARITNIPLGTVKSRMFYAVKNCQQTLRERGILE